MIPYYSLIENDDFIIELVFLHLLCLPHVNESAAVSTAADDACDIHAFNDI